MKYTPYTIFEKLLIWKQGINFTISMFHYWVAITQEPYDKIYHDDFFYQLTGEYFYNAIALENHNY